MITKILNSAKYGLNGLKTVWKEEFNFRLLLICGVVVVLAMFYFDFVFVEKVFCVLVIMIVLIAEMINTAIEDLCNKIEPNQDPIIGKIKDIASGLTAVSVFGAIIVGLLVLFHHFS